LQLPLILLLLLSSCASIKPDRTYNISQGEEFVIKLKANPSTGYQWKIKEGLIDSGLSLMKESYEPEPNPTDKPRLGAGGTKSWRFRAEKKGETILTFVYQRAGEKEPGQVKHFRVAVE
ncbi:MAG: protease inhibitor I42 family protein, partial [Bacteroidales bacterium]|nr:protease inhibitor I42 family protein [Bacteroidales bacterium]